MKFYSDKFLADLITDEIETRAEDDVAVFGSFPSDWIERLIVVRAYLIACMENVKNQEDIFSTKYKMYQREFDMLLSKARSEQSKVTPSVSMITIHVERG